MTCWSAPVCRCFQASVNSLPYQGNEERVFEAERGGDGEHGVEAAQQRAEQDQFADVRLHGQTGQVETQRCQVLWVVQGVLTHDVITQKNKTKITQRLVIFIFLIFSSKQGVSKITTRRGVGIPKVKRHRFVKVENIKTILTEKQVKEVKVLPLSHPSAASSTDFHCV